VGAKDEAWRAIAAQLALGAVAATAASSVAPSAAAAAKGASGLLLPSTLAGKAALTIAAGSVAVGSYLAVQSAIKPTAREPAAQVEHARSAAEPPPLAAPAAAPALAPAPTLMPTPAPAHAHAPALTPAPAPPTAEPLYPPTDRNQQEPRSARHPITPQRNDRLAAESALLTEARAQLRAGDPTAARAALDRLAAQFPHGVLIQEREVLAIELLSAQGDVAGARRQARAFVGAYPTSPHSAKLRAFLSAP